MLEPLRVCIYDAVKGDESPLRPPLQQVPGLVMLGAASNWHELRDWLRHSPPDVVAIQLDVAGGMDLETTRRLAEVSPNCSIIGVSSHTDASSIIAAMRAGCSQFVCWPIDQPDLNEAIARIRSARVSTVHAARRVCVIGSSGGAGATTVACNLAIELAHHSHRRTALVDMNLEFGDVACAFDCTPRFTIADACSDGVELDRTLLTKALHELPCNVSILARPESIEDAAQVSAEGVRNMFRVLSEMLPFVVVDMPRSFNALNGAAVRDADFVLIVTQLGVPFIRNASRIYEGLREMGVAEAALEIVLNRCKSVYERITPDDVESHFGKPVFTTIPNDYRRVQTAMDLGHPIVADAPNTPARIAIAQMAKRIAGQVEGIEAGPSNGNGNGGLLSRFWGSSRKDKAEASNR